MGNLSLNVIPITKNIDDIARYLTNGFAKDLLSLLDFAESYKKYGCEGCIDQAYNKLEEIENQFRKLPPSIQKGGREGEYERVGLIWTSIPVIRTDLERLMENPSNLNFEGFEEYITIILRINGYTSRKAIRELKS
ncbi:hypothetical protein HYU09_00670 [Candidatus Woesearchaeota archaeon]|nr:hypothetical protein [Candidatus Woesearchaeota archaeon]